MPRSDDAYDLVHTYDQAKAGKSKTARPAVRELGRDGAPVRLFVQEVRDPALVNTPPSGVRYVFVDQDGDLRRKNPDGSDELAVPTTPNDASYLTVNSEAGLSDERQVTTSSRVSVTDNGPDSTAEIDVVEDQIEAGNLAGSTGSAGQVLTTDGSTASFGAGAQNVPNWEEDPNSPASSGSTGSFTFTLSSSTSQALVLIEVDDQSSGGQTVQLDLGADDHGFTLSDGTTTSGASQFDLGRFQDPGGESSGWLRFVRGEFLLHVTGPLNSGAILSQAPSFLHGTFAGSDPLSSITVQGASGDISVPNLEVYTR